MEAYIKSQKTRDSYQYRWVIIKDNKTLLSFGEWKDTYKEALSDFNRKKAVWPGPFQSLIATY